MTSLEIRLAAAQLKERRPPALVPTTELPRLHERAYYQLIREQVLEVMRELVERHVLPEVRSVVREAQLAHDSLVTDLDTWALTLARVIDGVRVQFARRVSDDELAELIRRRVASGVAVANNQLNRNQLKVLLGIDILGSDPELRSLAEGFVQQNVQLIKTIPERYFTQVQQTVLDNVRQGRRAEVIEREIRARYPQHAQNAELIARDQTAKLNAQITERRHKALGITSYIWRTSMDDRVRPGHRVLEGETFSYDKPPIVDPRTGRRANPGGDFRCRCTAEPVIPGIDTPSKRAPKRPRAVPKASLPPGVPTGYGAHPTTPSTPRWRPAALAKAVTSFVRGQFTKAQQLAVRRELNALAASQKLVSRTLVNNAVRDQVLKAREVAADWRAGRLSFAAAKKHAEKELGRAINVEDNPAGRSAIGRLLEHLALEQERRVTWAQMAPALGTEAGDLQVARLADARADCNLVTGRIRVRPDVAAGFVRFLKGKGKGVARSDAQDLKTFIHETVHAHSPMNARLYRGTGKALEEATTEIAAQALFEKAATGWKVSLGAVGAGQVESSYPGWVRALVAAVAEITGVPHVEAVKHARAAALAMRRHTGDVAQSVDEYLHMFARQLPDLRKQVEAAERAAEKDWEAKMAKAAKDPAFAERLLGSSDIGSPDAIIAATRERRFRVLTAGLAVTKDARAALTRHLHKSPW